jgi:hypothetical protein
LNRTKLIQIVRIEFYENEHLNIFRQKPCVVISPAVLKIDSERTLVDRGEKNWGAIRDINKKRKKLVYHQTSDRAGSGSGSGRIRAKISDPDPAGSGTF